MSENSRLAKFQLELAGKGELLISPEIHYLALRDDALKAETGFVASPDYNYKFYLKQLVDATELFMMSSSYGNGRYQHQLTTAFQTIAPRFDSIIKIAQTYTEEDTRFNIDTQTSIIEILKSMKDNYIHLFTPYVGVFISPTNHRISYKLMDPYFTHYLSLLDVGLKYIYTSESKGYKGRLKALSKEVTESTAQKVVVFFEMIVPSLLAEYKKYKNNQDGWTD